MASARLLKTSAPTCTNCMEARRLAVGMEGPRPDPLGRTAGLFFVCPRCNHAMRDRRKSPSERPVRDFR